MATLAESLVSTTSRRLSLRMRPDLDDPQTPLPRRSYWVVKEPIGLNYFRFHEEEFAILQMLDGQSSLDSIKERFEADFAPQKITFQDLQQFIGMLHRSGLVISETAGQGRQLAKRRGEKKRREWLGRLSNVFALRWRGVDPERFLSWLYRYTWWMFHPLCVALCLALGIAALLLVTVQFDVFRSRLPTFHEFFDPRSPDKWIYLALTMGCGEGLARVGPRPVLQAFRGRMPRDRFHAAGAYALPVLQRVRLLDAAEQVAAGHDRRGGHVRRGGAGVRSPPSCGGSATARPAEQSLSERDVHLFRQHADLSTAIRCCGSTAITS